MNYGIIDLQTCQSFVFLLSIESYRLAVAYDEDPNIEFELDAKMCKKIAKEPFGPGFKGILKAKTIVSNQHPHRPIILSLLLLPPFFLPPQSQSTHTPLLFMSLYAIHLGVSVFAGKLPFLANTLFFPAPVNGIKKVST